MIMIATSMQNVPGRGTKIKCLSITLMLNKIVKTIMKL